MSPPSNGGCFSWAMSILADLVLPKGQRNPARARDGGGEALANLACRIGADAPSTSVDDETRTTLLSARGTEACPLTGTAASHKYVAWTVQTCRTGIMFFPRQQESTDSNYTLPALKAEYHFEFATFSRMAVIVARAHSLLNADSDVRNAKGASYSPILPTL